MDVGVLCTLLYVSYISGGVLLARGVLLAIIQ